MTKRVNDKWQFFEKQHDLPRNHQWWQIRCKACVEAYQNMGLDGLPRLIPVRRRWPSTSTSAVTSPPREAEDPVIEQGADAIEFWSEILELLRPDDSALPSIYSCRSRPR
ncbi:hypothetical protein SPRG_13440 [Saprolegnia parasitica CBS 223.65]|uniref:Uncharacterized protein n=1 Tax=Saprolegnia parasitica (strain CBS 223.65) TaxID=695850 RepID=A0A067C082_SAPPC|nr:hypothetical protein SPRG_13440 [Saprolegnia parasitica CBS 223.65]KDO20187.1 hypothetical protein SPRG_13440 [Saprolegnia parasitica CBS 223.65]|eukprot:XP_012209075.1 hypothetical protein SPRG_13440 [Saprolegnia parasitica CBS 223.65]